MAFITADRVKDTSTTTGTGNITVSGSAPFGYRTFSTVLSVSDTFYYCIQGQGTSEWEVGLGTYVSSNQFARTTVLSSSASGSAVPFSSGIKNVFITLAADKTLQIGPSSSVTVPTVIGGTTASSSLTLQSTSGVGTTDSILFKVGNNGATTAMTIDTSGNASLAANLTFSGTAQRITGDMSNATIASRLAFQSSTTNGQTIPIAFPNGTSVVSGFAANSSSSDPANASEMTAAIVGASDVRFSSAIRGTGTYLPMTFYTGGSERMRIDSSGNLLVGGTTQRNAAKQTIEFTTGNNGLALYCVANTNAVDFVNFYANSGNLCGSISRVGTTSAVAYNVSSDYRLKHDIKPMELGLETIEKLKPVTYKWNEDNSFGEGFIAHELQEIIPFAVNGTKDAVNENGSIKTQGVDYSKIVVHLVKAIQELSAKNDALEARLAKLETVQ